MITRRLILRGLVAAPAVVAVSSLMPIRGIIIKSARQIATEDVIAGLKADGLWNKLDHLWIFNLHSYEDAMLDLKCGGPAARVGASLFDDDGVKGAARC